MAHFIFSVVVVLLWLVAWGIYLVFGKNLKREMEGIENSDPNQNNPFITCCYGYWRCGYQYFFPRYQTNR
ncbi:hypothetical protein VN1172_09840 [Helicobacter pylori]|nr:hypothetical protein VN1200_09760 [Helicobacter pylori]GHQ62577.1 hypothetical protein VN1229_09120 [Helicobacter pylori]GHR47586.1 hypothetical protein VN1262_09100 [Helicobacter pylori]GHS58813.1 hypothetical protein VN1172_09840 [Helicobacter pylori]